MLEAHERLGVEEGRFERVQEGVEQWEVGVARCGSGGGEGMALEGRAGIDKSGKQKYENEFVEHMFLK